MNGVYAGRNLLSSKQKRWLLLQARQSPLTRPRHFVAMIRCAGLEKSDRHLQSLKIKHMLLSRWVWEERGIAKSAREAWLFS